MEPTIVDREVHWPFEQSGSFVVLLGSFELFVEATQVPHLPTVSDLRFPLLRLSVERHAFVLRSTGLLSSFFGLPSQNACLIGNSFFVLLRSSGLVIEEAQISDTPTSCELSLPFACFWLVNYALEIGGRVLPCRFKLGV